MDLAVPTGADASTSVTATTSASSTPPISVASAVIGPYASIDAGVKIRNAVVRDSIIDAGAVVNNCVLENALIGKNAKVSGRGKALFIGDDSVVETG